jgi:hypothetical protein
VFAGTCAYRDKKLVGVFVRFSCAFILTNLTLTPDVEHITPSPPGSLIGPKPISISPSITGQLGRNPSFFYRTVDT